MFWNKLPNQKSFKNSTQKIKKDAEQFPSPSEQTQTAKNPTNDQQKKPQFLFPQPKKTHKHVTPPARFGSKNPWKNPPASPAALAAAKACRCWSAGIGRPKPPAFWLGTLQGWLVGLPVEKNIQNITISRGFPKLLRSSSPVVCFFKKGVCWKKTCEPFPEVGYILYDMETGIL